MNILQFFAIYKEFELNLRCLLIENSKLNVRSYSGDLHVSIYRARRMKGFALWPYVSLPQFIHLH